MRGKAGAFTLKLLPLPSVNIALLLLSAGEFTAGNCADIGAGTMLASGGSCAKPVRNGAKLLEVTHSSTQPATVTCWAVRHQGLKSRKFAGFCTLDIILYLLSPNYNGVHCVLCGGRVWEK